MTSTSTSADKTDKIAITLPRSILQKMEKVRGDIPRSTYIRRAVEKYLKQTKAQRIWVMTDSIKDRKQFASWLRLGIAEQDKIYQ